MASDDKAGLGVQALQKYMDAIQPSMNCALNQLARDRPDKPLQALSRLLAEPALYKASPALSKMLGKPCSATLREDAYRKRHASRTRIAARGVGRYWWTFNNH